MVLGVGGLIGLIAFNVWLFKIFSGQKTLAQQVDPTGPLAQNDTRLQALAADLKQHVQGVVGTIKTDIDSKIAGIAGMASSAQTTANVAGSVAQAAQAVAQNVAAAVPIVAAALPK